mmetsp:Transcript_37368/g.74022  ORF Transcript_37368/g.74022 Transcript_37368/m.74022 type:complete len:219 (-) Transcript_37368:237-893(-)
MLLLLLLLLILVLSFFSSSSSSPSLSPVLVSGASSPLLVAVDCGAAPGGWTKLLAESGCCETVFAVDPADIPLIDDHVASTLGNRILSKNGGSDAKFAAEPDYEHDGGVMVHLRCKIQDAILRFQKNSIRADVWVSDMCLQEMEAQHDIFASALAAGVVSRGALVVLTLKCTKGHSKESFDAQAAQEVARLETLLKDVRVLHLMSNRSGERTVVGFVE